MFELIGVGFLIVVLVVEDVYLRYKCVNRDREIRYLRSNNEKLLKESIDNCNLLICAKNIIKKHSLEQELIDESDKKFGDYYYDKINTELFLNEEMMEG